MHDYEVTVDVFLLFVEFFVAKRSAPPPVKALLSLTSAAK